MLSLTVFIFAHSRIFVSSLFFTPLFFMSVLKADDWPQWRGQNRNGVWHESGILETIPEGGLKFRWRVRIGRGYSGPVVSRGRVYVTDHQFNPEVERVLCFDEATGESVWEYSYSVSYAEMEYGNGPRASPTVHKDKVYTLGTQGHLYCLNAVSGAEIWKKDLAREYHARVPQYGASVAPLIADDLVLICIGGEPDASVIAFDRLTGKERWKSLNDRPAYSAPIMINRGGAQQAIVWTADNIVSLNPKTGNVYWNESWKTTFNEAQVVASPVLHQNRLLFVMAWNRGSMMLNLDSGKPFASQVWKTRSQPSTMMSTPVFIDDNHFCCIDRVGGLCCIEASTGDEVWRSTEVSGRGVMGQAHITPNGDRYFLFNQRGQLIVARITPEGYEEQGRTLLVEPTAGYRPQGPVAWAHPAYANKHVIARNDKVLVSASLDSGAYPESTTSATTHEEKARVLTKFVGRNAALSLDFSPDSQTLALGTKGGNVKFVNVSTGDEIDPVPSGLRNKCCAISFSPEGKLLAYGGGTEFKQARNKGQKSGKLFVWDLKTGTSLHELKGHTSQVMSVAFSFDGKSLASASADKTIRLWNLKTGESRMVLKGHSEAVSSLTFTLDDNKLFSTSWDQTIKYWDTHTGDEIISLQGHDEEILSLALSSDGKTLATGSADWTIILWNITTGKQIRTLKGHHGAIYSLDFSSDSTRLASGSGDETIKIWNVQSGVVRKTLQGHQSGINAIAISPDHRYLVSAGRDDPVRLWEFDISNQ